MQLQEIDKVSITILIDNYTDMLLPNTSNALRNPMIKEERFLRPPLAEHGFSALIKIYHKIKKKIIIINMKLKNMKIAVTHSYLMLE